ncbi:MAG: peptidyl-prolyl cis-trans isomerase [Verrucomicrobiia bacterium]
MFISHHAWLHKYKTWIFTGVLFLLIPGFIAMFTPSFERGRANSDQPTIRGKPISATDLAAGRRSAIVQLYLARGEMSRTAAVEDYVNKQAVYHVVLLRKAAELGIRISDNDVIEQIRRLPPQFRSTADGRFGEGLLYLNNYGVSPTQFEQFIREEVIIQRLQALVTSAAKITPLEVTQAYIPRYEKVTVDLAEFAVTPTFEAGITVTDGDAKTFYEGKRNNRPNAELFRTPAGVKVRYVLFSFDEAKKSVTVTDQDVADFYERAKMKYAGTNAVPPELDAVKTKVSDDLLTIRALRLAADKATQFSVKVAPEPGMARPDFAKIAAESGVHVQETGFFSQKEPVPGVQAGFQFNNEAFALILRPDVPTSDPVEGKDGYYVLEFIAQRKSEIPPFDDVKDKVIQRLKKERALEAVRKQGQEDLAKVKQSTAGGKSFAAACATLDLKLKTSDPFTFSDKSPALPLTMPPIQELALGMATNAISEFLPTLDGGLFFHVKDRQPPDIAALESNKMVFAASLLLQNREALFTEWVQSVMQQEQVKLGGLSSKSQRAQETETDTETEPVSEAPQSQD